MEDDWGRDPSVQSLRRIFKAVEAKQGRLLEGLDIRRFDKRLGQWRKMTLHLFEERWTDAARSGVRLEENDVADLYLHCLAKTLATRGMVVPREAFPANPAVARLLEGKK
ncbi:MAG: hypothetical protein ABSC19_00045 [Syntrophorhabdales bacterium]